MKKIGLMLAVLTMFGLLAAQNVLLWDNDNYSSFQEPGGEDYFGCEVSLGRALLSNGINYTETNILPGNLSQYDAVFVTLGVYCVS